MLGLCAVLMECLPGTVLSQSQRLEGGRKGRPSVGSVCLQPTSSHRADSHLKTAWRKRARHEHSEETGRVNLRYTPPLSLLAPQILAGRCYCAGMGSPLGGHVLGRGDSFSLNDALCGLLMEYAQSGHHNISFVLRGYTFSYCPLPVL